MKAHTPAPWKVSVSPAKVPTRCIVREEKRGTQLVSRHVATVSVHGPDEENEANAHLLAAAPELQDALASLLDLAERYIPGPAQYNQVLRARALMAKLKGGAL